MRVQITDIAFDVDKGEYLLSDREEADFGIILEYLEAKYINKIVELTSDGSCGVDLVLELSELIESNTGYIPSYLRWKIV